MTRPWSEILREDLLEVAAVDRDRRFDVLEVLGGRMPAGPVRVEKGELREAEGDVGTGRAGAADRLAEPEAQYRFERLRPGR